MDDLNLSELTTVQLARVVRETYGTVKRNDVLQYVNKKDVTPSNARLFFAEVEIEDMIEIFNAIDADRSGGVDFLEIKEGFHEMGVCMTDEHLGNLAMEIDKDGNNLIDFNEFVALLFRVRLSMVKNNTAPHRCCAGVFWRPTQQQSGSVGYVRHCVWNLFDDPFSSTAASVVSGVILAVIVASCILFIIESLPWVMMDQKMVNHMATLDFIFVLVFSLEFVARLLSCPNLRSFVFNLLNWIDLIAILPYYVEHYAADSMLIDSGSLKGVRLVRVFRVLKVSRYLKWIRVFSSSLHESLFPLAIVFWIIILGTVFLANACHYTERGHWDDTAGTFVVNANRVVVNSQSGDPTSIFGSVPASGFIAELGNETFAEEVTESQFFTILTSRWFALGTLTTVGYGDIVPSTVLGKVISVVTALFGILVLAIPISVISTNFRNEYDKMKARMEIEQEQMRQHANLSPETAKEEFKTNPYLSAAVANVPHFAVAAASTGGDALSDSQLFATAVYKAARGNQKRVFQAFKHKERENRHALIEHLFELENEYLNTREVDSHEQV